MGSFRLSPLAESDLEHIWFYTWNEWSLNQANRYYDQIMDTIEELASGQKQGRKVDIRDGYLKYAVGRHLVFFRCSDGMTDVIRVLHRSMDAALHL
ncbi:MAG: type II toxin-antitoxin system RelE/ParE family toxin [Aestuariivita sp.]|nr:type II toxin-antitoxin system RelE/ParE family toxin [Aestuariivita sp.]